jgi:hypothetical protein
MSPACDYVQGKVIVPRLVGGYLIPDDFAQTLFRGITPPASILPLTPLWLAVNEVPASIYRLLLNCLLTASCPTRNACFEVDLSRGRFFEDEAF